VLWETTSPPSWLARLSPRPALGQLVARSARSPLEGYLGARACAASERRSGCRLRMATSGPPPGWRPVCALALTSRAAVKATARRQLARPDHRNSCAACVAVVVTLLAGAALKVAALPGSRGGGLRGLAIKCLAPPGGLRGLTVGAQLFHTHAVPRVSWDFCSVPRMSLDFCLPAAVSSVLRRTLLLPGRGRSCSRGQTASWPAMALLRRQRCRPRRLRQLRSSRR
jgi:hypothetical protein